MPPQAAGDRAYRLFCRPDLSPYRPRDHASLVAKARVHLARASASMVDAPTGPVQVYTFEPAHALQAPRTHLLIHGWTSEAALMAAFVEPLRSRGDRVIVFDLPAHGRSPGPVERRAASLIDCALGALTVAEVVASRHGPIDSIIAHSLGAMIAALIIEGGVPLGRQAKARRLVLIAAPNSVAGVARRYGARIGLHEKAGQQHFEHHLERVGRRPLALFTTARLLAAVPEPPELLIIHAPDDDVVPVEDAHAIANRFPDARLELHPGLGHAKVLYAPPVVRAVRNFVTKLEA